MVAGCYLHTLRQIVSTDHMGIQCNCSFCRQKKRLKLPVVAACFAVRPLPLTLCWVAGKQQCSAEQARLRNLLKKSSHSLTAPLGFIQYLSLCHEGKSVVKKRSDAERGSGHQILPPGRNGDGRGTEVFWPYSGCCHLCLQVRKVKIISNVLGVPQNAFITLLFFSTSVWFKAFP